MTKSEYNDYAERVDNFIKDNKVKAITCSDPETFFSSEDCECCHRPLGGDRYRMSALLEDDTVILFDVCPDCMYYNEYGTLDDLTMMLLTDDEPEQEDDWGTDPLPFKT